MCVQLEIVIITTRVLVSLNVVMKHCCQQSHNTLDMRIRLCYIQLMPP